MAKIARFTIKEFAKDAPSGEIGQFGSLAAGSPNYSKDPATLQALAAFLGGWADETLANNRPALEDFNALDFLIFQALCYFAQAGIPEYDAGTTYYTGSFCQVAGVIYVSLDDDNIANTPSTSPTKWERYISSGYKEVKMTAGTVAEIATEWPGWQLCDGTNGTPDLRDRFIVGARQDDSGVAKTNVTGALTKSGDGQIPAHVHPTYYDAAGDNVANNYPEEPYLGSSADAAAGNTGSYGTGTKVVAVYYALCFIMKPVS